MMTQRSLICTAVLLTILLAGVPALLAQPGWRTSPDPMGQQQWNYCPMCGAPAGGGGPSSAWRDDPGTMMPYHQTRRGSRAPLSAEDAKTLAMENLRNPNLKVGEIEDLGGRFEASIVTKESGELVDKWVIDKGTGWIRSTY